MSVQTELKKNLANPASWVVILMLIVGGVTSYNQIGQNADEIRSESKDIRLKLNTDNTLLEKNIKTVKNRLEKKIVIINDLLERVNALEIELSSRKTIIEEYRQLKEDYYKLQLEVEKMRVEMDLRARYNN